MPLNAIGGTPKAIVCDNLKAGVTAMCRYEPGINRTYQELAEHYDTAILPTRPRKPRDKAKVEVAVQIVQRYVLARLRNRRFFSLAELNAAIRECVADLNAKIMRKLGVSRHELFAEIDRPALKVLPSAPYQYAEWKKCRVAPDYHIEIADHYCMRAHASPAMCDPTHAIVTRQFLSTCRAPIAVTPSGRQKG